MAIPKAITFDCYGTIIDWDRAVQHYFKNILSQYDINEADVVALQKHWESIQFTYIQDHYRPYKEVLKHTMAMAFRDYGYSFSTDDCIAFSESMGSWEPFPDAKEALLELKKLTKIALITNTDDAIINETVKHLEVDFDEIITAEQAGAYKANHHGFHLALERLGIERSELLHVGFGFKYDVVPANELNIQSCWVNRYGETRPANVKETFLVGDMATLALLIKGMAHSAR
ncbi:HAD-IA family hydrolase [Salicibibacter cibi]|uniref:HAD-IA family hydrolase n=1 Tax=Salicibibacter cibi TaxID=2743001 RepID=A0A7T6ZA03_9BACI|nr:HAD-IA family hydrolase [Salicibibacter cibi]QQK79581.1 HAD-IA family hydrolase [Salicibibacter cibi]